MKTPEKSNHYYTATIRFFNNWLKRQSLPYRYTRGRRLIKPLPRYNLLTNHRTTTQYRRYVIHSCIGKGKLELSQEILEKAINELLSRPSRLDRILDQISLESERERA